MQKNPLLIATEILIILLIAGCGYQLINPTQKTVYVESFTNLTLQPEIDMYLLKNIRKTLGKSTGFIHVSNRKDAEIVIRGKIQEFSRNPEFISGADEIVMASYRVKVIVEVEKNGNTHQKEIELVYFMELSEKLKTEQLLDNISTRISQDIYFNLINSYEK